jgi:engulfment/cell motility protein 1
MFRMWHESSSTIDDFPRLTFLIRSQIRLSLADEAIKSWLHLERDFLETPYTIIRERQMEMLEKEDGMMTNPGVLELRESLGRDAYEVLKEQR